MERRLFIHFKTKTIVEHGRRKTSIKKASRKERENQGKQEREESGNKSRRQQKQARRGKAAAGPNDLNSKVMATDSGVCPGVFKRIENSELSTSPTPSNFIKASS